MPVWPMNGGCCHAFRTSGILDVLAGQDDLVDVMPGAVWPGVSGATFAPGAVPAGLWILHLMVIPTARTVDGLGAGTATGDVVVVGVMGVGRALFPSAPSEFATTMSMSNIIEQAAPGWTVEVGAHNNTGSTVRFEWVLVGHSLVTCSPWDEHEITQG